MPRRITIPQKELETNDQKLAQLPDLTLCTRSSRNVHSGARLPAPAEQTSVTTYYSERGMSQFYTSAPPELHDRITRSAKKQGISRNRLLTQILESWFQKPTPLRADYANHDRIRLRFWAEKRLSARIARYAIKNKVTRASVIYTALTAYLENH